MVKQFERHLRDSYLESWITDDMRDGCRRFVLRINTYVLFHPQDEFSESGNVWITDPWSPGDQEAYRHHFKKVIEEGFGNGAIWLLHDDKRVPDLWCDVQVTFTTKRLEAQLVVEAHKNPRGQKKILAKDANGKPMLDSQGNPIYGDAYLRASCYPWRRWGLINILDMTIPFERVVPAAGKTYAETRHWQPDGTSIDQQTLLHEFGHYLKLGHFCDSDGAANSSEEYCTRRSMWHRNDLMAQGNVFNPRKVGIPFRRRLDDHDYVRGRVEAWLATGHSSKGGGVRTKRPWPEGYPPMFDVPDSDPNW